MSEPTSENEKGVKFKMKEAKPSISLTIDDEQSYNGLDRST